MGFGQAFDDAQSQPRSFVDRFCGEERLHDLGSMGNGNPWPTVDHTDFKMAVSFFDLNPNGFFRRLFNGVKGIVEEIEKQLADLRRTALQEPIAIRGLAVQMDAAMSESRLAETQSVFDDRSQRNSLHRVSFGVASESPQSTDDFGDTVGGAIDAI